MQEQRFLICSAGLFVCLFVFPMVASSQTFSPVQCAPCTVNTEVAFEYRGYGQSNPDNWRVPIDYYTRLDPNAHYISREKTSILLVSNQRVKRIGIHNSFLDTEFIADAFLFGVQGYLDAFITGSYAQGADWFDSSDMTTATSGAVRLEFFANNSLGYEGFVFDKARVCCHPAGAAPSPIVEVPPMQRVEGFLLGQNDVIYIQTPGTGADEHLVVSMWHPGSADNNFTLYARCGSNPTPASYYVADKDGSSRFREIDIPNGYCAAGWRIAIHAASYGSAVEDVYPGAFSLYVTHHRASRHYGDFRVGMTKYPVFQSDGQIARVKNAVRRLFGATEGAVYIEKLTFYQDVLCQTRPPNIQLRECSDSSGLPVPWVCDCSEPGEESRKCGLCIIDFSPGYIGTDLGHAYTCLSSQATQNSACYYPNKIVNNPEKQERVITHELLHSKFCLNDEYNMTSSGFDCGHSMMGSVARLTYGLVNNVCFDDFTDYRCNHGWTGNSPPSPPTMGSCWQGQPGGWDYAIDRGSAPSDYYPQEDPDQFDFVDFERLPREVDVSNLF